VRVVCSYCQKDMGRKPPLDDGSLTHAMCPECGEHFGAQWSGMSYGEYVDRFPFPVVLIEKGSRVVAINKAACDFLGRGPCGAIGLLGGEALECVHARLPGGCGRTVHCPTCAIRNAVTRTHETGRPTSRIPAKLHRSDRTHDLLISTVLEGQVVRVMVEPAPAPTA